MADVLITHSYHLPYDPKQVRKMQPYPPLGTLYAASALKAGNISVAVFDTMLEDPDVGFAAALEQQQPRLVVIYEDDFNFLSKMCLTRMRELAWQLAREAQKAGAIVIAHGSDATDQAQLYLRNGVDFVLLGEAEQTLVELCSALLSYRPYSGIPGLVYLDLQETPCRVRVKRQRTHHGTHFQGPLANSSILNRTARRGAQHMGIFPPTLWPVVDVPIAVTGVPSRSPAISSRSVPPTLSQLRYAS